MTPATVDAGDFGSWLRDIGTFLGGDGDSVVPCGTCTGCCTSSQFVHVGPEETDALAHIPSELLFPAPRLPRGHFVLGYDERGHCPMLIDGACSIYDHRPRTCRVYDCRVLSAAGLDLADEPSKAAIDERVRRWRFSYESDDDKATHAAVIEVARSITDEPTNTGRALRALAAFREE